MIKIQNEEVKHFMPLPSMGEENIGREQVVESGLRITFFYYPKTIFRKNTGTKIQLKDTLTEDMPHIGR